MFATVSDLCALIFDSFALESAIAEKWICAMMHYENMFGVKPQNSRV